KELADRAVELGGHLVDESTARLGGKKLDDVECLIEGWSRVFSFGHRGAASIKGWVAFTAWFHRFRISKLDHGLEDPVSACDQLWNPARSLERWKRVRQKGIRRNHPALDCAHHPLEVGSQGVAACQERRFPLVELRIGKGNLLFHHAQEHVGPTMRYIVETTAHRVD